MCALLLYVNTSKEQTRAQRKVQIKTHKKAVDGGKREKDWNATKLFFLCFEFLENIKFFIPLVQHSRLWCISQ